MANAKSFVNLACKNWGLPMVGEKPAIDTIAPRPAKRQRVRSLDELPENTKPGHMYNWARTGGSFLVVVDCQLLQQVVCGQAPLKAEDLTAECECIVDSIGCLLGVGWQPLRQWEDPVLWQRRELNGTADFLANFTMDTGQSWTRTLNWPHPEHNLSECNIVSGRAHQLRRQRCKTFRSLSAGASNILLCHQTCGQSCPWLGDQHLQQRGNSAKDPSRSAKVLLPVCHLSVAEVPSSARWPS